MSSASYTTTDYLDLVTSTQKYIKRGEYTDISHVLRNHPMMDMMLAKERVKMETGNGYEWEVKVSQATAFQNVRLGQPIVPTQEDHLKTANVNWRHANTNWACEERVLAANKGSPEKIVDIISMKKSAAYIELADGMETNAWTAPASSSDDLKPFGIPYWIVKASGTPSFQGGAPTNHTLVANLNPSTYTNWKNWTGQYTAVTKDDLVRKMRNAVYKTKFKVPFASKSQEKMPRQDFEMWTTYTVVQQLEDMLQAQNDNLGTDVAKYDGQVTFKRMSIDVADYLDQNDSTNPVYGINWSYWCTVFLKGEYLNESKPEKLTAIGQHRTIVVHVDCTYNMVCENRHLGGWVLYV
jgi:hypothetical protein